MTGFESERVRSPRAAGTQSPAAWAAALRARTTVAAVAVWGVSVAIGFVILSIPEPPKRPLLEPSGWSVAAGFEENARPAAGQVSDDILQDATSRFFRSWTPADGAIPGTLRSNPFVAPDYLAIPYAGYPDERGAAIWLECRLTGGRLPVAQGNAHETWVERTLRVDPSWCPSPVQLVARSSSSTHYLAVGTPFTSSRLAWLKESVFVLLALHLMSWWLVIGPGVFVVTTLRMERRLSSLYIPAVTLLAGYLQFYLAYYARHAALALSILIAAVGAIGMVRLLQLVRREGGTGSLVTPLTLTFLLSLFYLGLLYAADLGAGSFTGTYRFDPAIWSTDNQLPQIVAEAVYQGSSLGQLLGAWRVSDRPPLMTGVFLLARPLWAPLLSVGDNLRFLFYFYQVLGLLLTALWAVPAWELLGTLRFTRRQRVIVLLFVATLGVTLFNSTYVWPKMLAATLALSGCLVLASARHGGPTSNRRVAGAGVLLGLGMMAHSGVIFGLPPAILAALRCRGRAYLRPAAVLAAAASIVVAPWVTWQRTEDPPGNALTKFAFAGTYGFEQPAESVLTTIARAYDSLTFEEWVAMRVDAIEELMLGASDGPGPEQLDDWMYKRQMDALGRERLEDELQLGRSFRIANAGWLILAYAALASYRRPRTRRRLRVILGWLAVGVAGVLLNVLTTWSIHITPTQSYLSVLLIALGLCASVLLAPAWLRTALLSLHAAYVGVVWIASPLMHVAIAIGPLVLCLSSAVALVGLLPRGNGPERTVEMGCDVADIAPVDDLDPAAP